MSDRKPTSIVMLAAAAVLVLLGLYVGAYFWKVEPVGIRHIHGPVEIFIPGYQDRFQSQSDNFWEQLDSLEPRTDSWWTTFFAPIHWLDRRIRPDVWEPTP